MFKHKSVSESARLAARHLVSRALSFFEARYPTYELDHKLLQVDHIADELPCHWYSEWPLERAVRFNLAHINNPNRKAASIAERMACSMGTIMHEIGRSEEEHWGQYVPLLRALALERPYDMVLRFVADRYVFDMQNLDLCFYLHHCIM